MSIITLTTDFGIQDAYAGAMKGVILSINPSAAIIDITHRVDPQDLEQAAYIIKSFYHYFPEGSIHVVVVDPGVGSDREIILLKTKGHTFIAPNNGVLTLIMDAEKTDSLFRADNPDYFLKPVSRTFHGRDIFAPVAAYISKGVAPDLIGTAFDNRSLVRLNMKAACISHTGELVGHVVSIDRFGNLITNISSDVLKNFCAKGTKAPVIMIGGARINGLSITYESVDAQTPLAITGSSGYLEISVNRGSAERFFNAKKNDIVRVST